MKGKQRFKAQNCRGGGVSRKFWGAYAAGVLASAARRNEFVDLAPQKSQITNHHSLITVHALLLS
jgi:hypothetical protein